ncbi:hypothetical protein L1987_68876 [Smallanthus sonchifolius]|uniref:Uncharacterized protein n=1 Tax=Smallanthus sonchifolius TaxID=185202 RepID=A0ACB9B5Y4_9ASTR|nr:hypothetical protein L1987_68876 [Smallanthus sonchifolius]
MAVYGGVRRRPKGAWWLSQVRKEEKTEVMEKLQGFTVVKTTNGDIPKQQAIRERYLRLNNKQSVKGACSWFKTENKQLSVLQFVPVDFQKSK